VVGEVQRLRPNRNGHLFFELIEKGAADEIVGKLEAVIWRRRYGEVRRALAAAGQQIAEGQELRCRAKLDFYPPFGRMQLVVSDVDLVFALGQLAARRRATLQSLTEAGLLDRNAGLPLIAHPLDLALVTAGDSAAYHDFVETLRESGFGFRVILIDTPMQGRQAEEGVASALIAASELEVDACILIRGGGSKTDLAAFDSRRVAEAVARSRVPVLTGLGHQIDESIADRVAHTALKTPTKVADFLVGRVTSAEEAVRSAEGSLVAGVRYRIERESGRVELARGQVRLARHRLTAALTRLGELGGFLARAAARLPTAHDRSLGRIRGDLGRWAPRLLARRARAVETVGQAIARSAESGLRAVRATVEGRRRLVQQLGPDRVLARGFSITRDEAGMALRRAEQIRYGQALTTQLAEGTIRSRVEEG
jgi:exodeoxyribonuclease VII large subunit